MGCASSKHLETVLKAEGLERYSKSLKKKSKSKNRHGNSNGHHNHQHHVALTSSTYGIFSPETFQDSDFHQKQEEGNGTRQRGKSFDSSGYQVYEKIKNFELNTESGPQSWSEVSQVLENIKAKGGLDKKKQENPAVEKKKNDDDGGLGGGESGKSVRERIKAFDSNNITFHTVEELDARIEERKGQKPGGATARISSSSEVGSPRGKGGNFGQAKTPNGRSIVSSADLGSRQGSHKSFHGPNLDLNENGSEAPKSPLFEPELLVSFENNLKNLSEEDWNATRNKEAKFKPRQETSSSVVNTNSELVGVNDQGSELVGVRDKKSEILGVKDKGSEFAGVKERESPHKVVEAKRNPLEDFEEKCPPGGEKAVVLYTTTLRGIRKTFEDCNKLRSVLENLGVPIDERDVSMHLEFRNELKELMGKPVPVPRLFIKGRYIGGAEEVLQLNDDGKLDELLSGLSTGVASRVCEGCGGMRFVPCLECSGSCKLVKDENIVVRCPDCNENGLIQCPICH